MALHRGKTLTEWKKYVKKDKQVCIRTKKYIIVLEELVEELSSKLEQQNNVTNEVSVCELPNNHNRYRISEGYAYCPDCGEDLDK